MVKATGKATASSVSSGSDSAATEIKNWTDSARKSDHGATRGAGILLSGAQNLTSLGFEKAAEA